MWLSLKSFEQYLIHTKLSINISMLSIIIIIINFIGRNREKFYLFISLLFCLPLGKVYLVSELNSLHFGVDSTILQIVCRKVRFCVQYSHLLLSLISKKCQALSCYGLSDTSFLVSRKFLLLFTQLTPIHTPVSAQNFLSQESFISVINQDETHTLYPLLPLPSAPTSLQSNSLLSFLYVSR